MHKGPGILNTRPREQAAELNQRLREAGYKSYNVPLVELVFLAEGLAELSRLSQEEYDGVLLSSPNLTLLLKKMNSPLVQALALKPWYLISNRARPQVEALGVKVAFVPRKASLEGFLEELPAKGVAVAPPLFQRHAARSQALFGTRD
jgi:uroporphyrinogen-III synthase